jgi:hypothetical protein
LTSSSGPIGERLTALERAVEAGDRAAVDRFWRRVEKAGAPLVEGRGDRVLVTFIWRGTDAAAVALQSPLGGVEGMGGLDPSRNRLTLVPGTASTIVGGASLGGVGAVFAALRRPDVFGNVLSQSGAFWLKGPDGASEWLCREVTRSPRLALRVYLDAGSLEGRQLADGPTQAEANRHLCDALRSKGAAVTYAEFAGGHDQLCWRGTLADGLIALLGAGVSRADREAPSVE